MKNQYNKQQIIPYHIAAQNYLDKLIDIVEDILPDVDIKEAGGVFSFKVNNDQDTYVLNMQDPIKQLWMSSPQSGPTHYDQIKDKFYLETDHKIELSDVLRKEIQKYV